MNRTKVRKNSPIQSGLSLLVILCSFFLSSCSDQEVAGSVNDVQGEVVFSLSTAVEKSSTRATTDGIVTEVAALDREKQLHNVYAVVFREDGSFYQTFPFADATLANPADKLYKFTMPLAGKYYMYVVANTNINLADAAVTQTFTDEEKFYQYVNTEAPGVDKHQAANKFLMLSPKILLDVDGNNTTDVGTIDLTRAVARIDIDCSAIEGMKLTKVQWQNRYTTTYFARGAKGTDMTDTKLTRKTLTLNKPTSAEVTDEVWRACLYGYENLYSAKEVTATEFPTQLVLTGTCDGIDITHTIVFEDVPLLRNHLYNVILKPAGTGAPFEELEYNIEVKDWDTGETLQLVNEGLTKSVQPDFTVEGAWNEGAVGGKNPTNIALWQNEQTFTITATGSETSFQLNSSDFTEDMGTIMRHPIERNLDGTFTQKFTIKMKQTLVSKYKVMNMSLVNSIDPTKKRDFTITRVRLPIEYVSKTELQEVGKFAPDSHTPHVMFISWTTATDNYNPDNAKATIERRTIDGKVWHMPTLYEYIGIVPYTNNYIRFNATTAVLSETQRVDIGLQADRKTPRQFTLANDYMTPVNNGIAYGFRFKNSQFASAYRWQYLKDSPDNPGYGLMKITVRYLGYDYGTHAGEGINQIADEAWWNDAEKNQYDIVRLFPMLSYIDGNTDRPAGTVTGLKAIGSSYYWSRTTGGNGVYTMYVNNGTARNDVTESGSYAWSLRLFEDDYDN